MLHGLCHHPRDPKCRVGSIYPVKHARKILFKGHGVRTKGKGTYKKDFSEAQGRFCKADFPETFKMFEEEVQTDSKVMELNLQTQGSLKSNPRFERDQGLTVAYSTSANTKKLKSVPFGAAVVQNPQRLEKYQLRALNLNGCLLSRLAKYGRKDNIGVVLAINDTCDIDGSSLPCLPDAIKRIVTHFVRAIVLAGLPKGELLTDIFMHLHLIAVTLSYRKAK